MILLAYEEYKKHFKKNMVTKLHVETSREEKIYNVISTNEFFKREDESYISLLAYSIDRGSNFPKTMNSIYDYLESKGVEDVRKKKYYFKLKKALTKEILKDVSKVSMGQ